MRREARLQSSTLPHMDLMYAASLASAHRPGSASRTSTTGFRMRGTCEHENLTSVLEHCAAPVNNDPATVVQMGRTSRKWVYTTRFCHSILGRV